MLRNEIDDYRSDGNRKRDPGVGKNPMVYNRTSEFCSVIKEIDGNLKYVFNTKNQVFILTCSGTGAMEAAIVNTLSRNDEVVIANNGVFGQRWVEICNNYGLNVKEIKGTFGQTIDPEKIRLVITEDTKAVIITANETSSGTVSDVQRIGEVVKKTNSLLIVDAISDLCCDEFKTDEWHCDVVVVSSNKGLAVPPGLAFITFSEKAWKSVNNSNLPKYYFDIKTYQKIK